MRDLRRGRGRRSQCRYLRKTRGRIPDCRTDTARAAAPPRADRPHVQSRLNRIRLPRWQAGTALARGHCLSVPILRGGRDAVKPGPAAPSGGCGRGIEATILGQWREAFIEAIRRIANRHQNSRPSRSPKRSDHRCPPSRRRGQNSGVNSTAMRSSTSV